jgi:tRNA-dihydrouridine synthase
MVGSTDLPVTLKTRLGPHPQKTSIFRIAEMAERAGAKGLIVHARYTSQLHGGITHLDVLSELVAETGLPVTGNGSVVNAAGLAAMAATGVKAVMIGRAALSDPALFAGLKDGKAPPVPKIELCKRHLQHILDFRERLAAAYPGDHVPSADAFASVKMHTHLFRYFNGRPGAAALRARLNKVRTLSEIKEIIADEESID